MKSLRDFYFMRAAARQRQHREYGLFRQSPQAPAMQALFFDSLKLSDVFLAFSYFPRISRKNAQTVYAI